MLDTTELWHVESGRVRKFKAVILEENYYGIPYVLVDAVVKTRVELRIGRDPTHLSRIMGGYIGKHGYLTEAEALDAAEAENMLWSDVYKAMAHQLVPEDQF